MKSNKLKGKFYTGGYSNCDNNFVITGIEGKITNEFTPTFAVLKNILLRGSRINPSKYLNDSLNISKATDEWVPLIDEYPNDWSNIIKGHSRSNQYPAYDFFYEKLPKLLGENSYITQLIIPEVQIQEIVHDAFDEFAIQEVDFYVPDLKIVIEIDGSQHERELQKQRDTARDQFLSKHSIRVFRLTPSDIYNESSKFTDFVNILISDYESDKKLVNYRKFYNNISVYKDENIRCSLIATAVLRLQITILDMLLAGKIALTDKTWSFNFINNEINGYENFAFEDVFTWLEKLFSLRAMSFERPNVQMNNGDCPSSITIDISLFKRWTYQHKSNEICIRSDYSCNDNYYITETAEENIKYKIEWTEDSNQIIELRELLFDLFGFEGFNDGQLPSIINVLNGNDTVGLLPTGGGKSLIYQYSCLLQPCISYVVVPIVSLMDDQIHNMKNMCMTNVAMINSTLDAQQKEDVLRDFGSGCYQIILISPERFQSQKFRESIQNINETKAIGLAVIDEIHCLSEWGHDFRVSYLNLSKTITEKTSPGATILGLTATASLNVLKDIKVEFDLTNENIKTLPNFTRKELSFKVISDSGLRSSDKLNNLLTIVDELDDEGIFDGDDVFNNNALIFTRNVNGNKGCYELANTLAKHLDKEVKWYSGSIPKKSSWKGNVVGFNNYKREVQSRFKASEFPILVATKAFGMGIDKSNIRSTIHYGIPPTLESLYQEAGRAGRDRKDAKCYVLFSDEETGKDKLDRLFDLKTPITELNKIQEAVGFNGRDVFTNMFLWLNGTEDYQTQSNNIKRVYVSLSNDEHQLLSCTRIGLTKTETEKVLYKLSIMGIIKDWTVEDWDEKRAKFNIVVDQIVDEEIESNILSYINKYDPEFEFEGKDSNYNFPYSRYYNDDILDKFSRLIKILIVWQYEHIMYSRRESIRTVYDQCLNFESSDGFKKYIENYFRFDEVTYSYEYMIENPLDFIEWFEVFTDDKDECVGIEDIRSQIPAIRRYLESFSNNTGLNFLSGIMHLLIDQFSDNDGMNRLELAYNNISSLEIEDQYEIINQTMRILSNSSIGIRNQYSNFIHQYYSDISNILYEGLKDHYSLNIILGRVTQRLKSIGGVLNEDRSIR